MTQTTRPSTATMMTVDEAASKALGLVQRFASVENPQEQSIEKNPWQDPQRMLDELIQARQDIMQAWNNNNNNNATNDDDDDGNDDERDFRALYMDMITDAFADVLEELQSSDTETLNVDVLVDCLQSGLELLDPKDKDVLFRGMDADDNADNDMDQGDDEQLTPHEAHRRKLGFAL
jgi:hypothetical protein